MRAGWVFGAVFFLTGCGSGSVKVADTGSGPNAGTPTGLPSTGTGTGATGTGTGAVATGTGATGTGTGATGTGTGSTGTGTGATGTGTGSTGTGTGATGTGTGSTGPCGDGFQDPGEACDDGAANDDTLSDACRTSCDLPGCGDSVVDFGLNESCDDGNAIPGDGCAGCALEAAATCGDGAWDIANGEECDDGNLGGGDGCDPSCQLEAPAPATCGDGANDPVEVCDDNNNAAGDGCNPTCTNGGVTSAFAGTQGTQGNVDAIGTLAQLGGAGTLTIDGTYLYYADSSNRTIRRIEIATGLVTTIAGNGTQATTDNAVGTSASFSGLEAIATDGTRLWVADGQWLTAAYIREIDLSCPNPLTDCYAVTTIAGGPSIGQADGPALSATFDDLRGLTYYSGALYFVDGNGATLRTLDLTTQVVSTLAGQAYTLGSTDGYGAAGRMQSPRYMTSDGSGNLYIADTNGNKIRSYNTVTGYLGTFAGDGTAGYVDGIGTAARISRPRGMASDGSSIYWVEFNDHTVRQGHVATRAVTTHVGQVGQPGYAEGTGVGSHFRAPFSCAWHASTDTLFVVDGGNYLIRRVD